MLDNVYDTLLLKDQSATLDIFLQVIIQWSGEPQEGVMSWADLIKLGKQQTDEAFELRLKQQAVNQCCTLIYTSGECHGKIMGS